MDMLSIHALKVNAIIGVFDWEKQIRQTLLIDIDIEQDFSALNDDIKNTLDYDALCNHVITLVESHSFQLIETVATMIADTLRADFAKVGRIVIKVGKPNAVMGAKNVIATVERS